MYNPRMAQKTGNNQPSNKSTKQSTGTSLISPNTKLTITLPKSQVSSSYTQALTQLAKNVTTPGFRKGKVPSKVAEDKLGQGKIIERVLDTLLPEAYQQSLKQAQKNPLTQPEFTIVSAELGKDWIISAEFAQLPTVDVKNHAKYTKTGLKTGEKALAEQQKAARKAKTSPKTATKQKPSQKLPETPAKETKLQHIFRELVLQIKPQVPEMLLKQETQHEFEHLTGQLKQLGMSVDDYLKRRNMDMDKLSQELAVTTLNRLQLDLILGAIAKEKKLAVTEHDRIEYFKQIKDEKQREQLSKDPHYLGHLDTNLTKQKVVDYLLTL
jgi:FKBP-type peptidyl-prolyl cis-trans isomerase (trigger factor)